MNISFENVSYEVNKQTILEKVNINILKNDFIGIIGPNGGGKTTFLKLILGLIKPTSGKISISGHCPQEMRKYIGYVPQKTYIDIDFPISVFDLVMLGSIEKSTIFYKKKLKKKATSLIEQVGLGEKKDFLFGKLSGGEMQRALIARALIKDPQILILDEPTSNIDIKAEKEIFNFLLKDKNKKTILLVSHDLEMIIKEVKKVVFVDKKVEERLPEKVCEHFALGLYHRPLNPKE